MSDERAKTAPSAPAVGAFVLCGGLGTRLRSVLSDRPKSLASVAGVPFLRILVERIRSQGIREIVLGTGHLAGQIEEHFGDGHDLGLTIRYSREQAPLGTGGAVKLAQTMLSDPALILNGDSYVEWDLAGMLQFADTQKADLVMALQSVADVSRYGNVMLADNGRIIQFIEKGLNSGPGLINAGVYLLRKAIVRELPKDKAVSLERDIFPRLLSRRVYGLVSEGPFIDIGLPDDLERAQTLLAGKLQS
ncbi:MAG: NTP transferase domain-containing protein [Chthoniobacterales bacterium]|nr:NTP transferase domain-containing protein [Chthoniobacterales bacterium]